MSGRHLSSEDRRELARLTKILAQKIVQIIVQSRLGEKALTKSKNPTQGSDWFNLGIEDIQEINQETKKFLGGQLPDVGKSLVVEILLRTPESDILTLEVWTLAVLDAPDTSPARIYPTINNRMSVLLKSLLAVTRITPAYKLSFRQGKDSFTICYRVFLGEPNYEALGDNYEQARLGKISTPVSTLVMCVSYRTRITIDPAARSPAHDPIMVKSDHFKPEVSPRHCRRIADRTSDSSEAAQTSDESQEAVRLFTASPLDNPPTPRSRTSSESSSRGTPHPTQQPPPLQQLPPPLDRKISVPFADSKPPKSDEFFMPDVPFSNLLASVLEPLTLGDKKTEPTGAPASPKEHEAGEKGESGAVGGSGGGDKVMVASDSSHRSNKSITSAQLRDAEAEYVMVDLKTPFAGPSEHGADLGMFYRECQTAPPLRMFSDTPEDELNDLSQQLLGFEAHLDEYNELYKSLHEDESPNSDDD